MSHSDKELMAIVRSKSFSFAVSILLHGIYLILPFNLSKLERYFFAKLHASGISTRVYDSKSIKLESIKHNPPYPPPISTIFLTLSIDP